jgi:photosystem II stability/assembly factor-like uncharacterized protein
MVKKKLGLLVGMIVVLLFVTACAQTEQEQELENGEKTSLENSTGTSNEEQKSEETEEDLEAPVDSFMHIHGLSYDKKEPYSLYMSSHHGLIQINGSGQWNWIGEPKNRHDLMGFTVQSEDIMISSGHPVKGSKLKNPMGVVISKDSGQTWEPIALHGMVDFHVFEVNAGDSTIVYGINSHGAHAGIYRSLDGGSEWDKQQAKGLPSDLSTIYSLVSNPEDPQSILVGTQGGIFASADGGQTWTLTNNALSFTSAKGVKYSSGLIVAYLLGENEGLMSSTDFGNTWTSLNLKLEEDAAMHIAIHPKQEGVYAVGTYNEHLLQTADGGATWTKLATSGKPAK